MRDEEVEKLATWQALQLVGERTKFITKNPISRYQVAKEQIQMVKLAKTDEEILQIYERVYLRYCRFCKDYDHPDPFYHTHCPVYAVKRASFERISNKNSLRELAEKLNNLRIGTSNSLRKLN